MNLNSLLSQLEELSRQWHEKDYGYYGSGPREDGKEWAYHDAADELDFLIAQAREATTDTVP